jgi:hypothetical protein
MKKEGGKRGFTPLQRTWLLLENYLIYWSKKEGEPKGIINIANATITLSPKTNKIKIKWDGKANQVSDIFTIEKNGRIEAITPNNKRSKYKLHPKPNAIQACKEFSGMKYRTEVEMILLLLQQASLPTTATDKNVEQVGFATMNGEDFFLVLCKHALYAFSNVRTHTLLTQF